MHTEMIALVLPKIGDRIRIAIRRDDVWLPIGWLRIGEDGSLYFGLLFGKPDSGGMLIKPTSQTVRIDYDEVQEFDRQNLPSSSRVSFKASGEIHLGEGTLCGEPLESLTDTLQLCLFHQTHPSKLPPPIKKNPNDYDVGIEGYQFREDQPLFGALFVSPWKGERTIRPIKLDSMEESFSIAFGFAGLSCTPDLLIQIVIGHGPRGVWPPFPGVLVLSKGEED